MGAATEAVYLKVLADLRAQIRDGVLAPGARVPSRNGIIARYGVGETAAKHALAVLAAEGLIETRAGSGSYVRPVPAPGYLEHDRPHSPGSPFGLAAPRPAAGQEAGVTAPLVAWQHRTEHVPAPWRIARQLGLAANDPVTRTTYLITAGGNPVQLSASFEPASLTAHTRIRFPEEGPYAGRGVIERMRVIGVWVDSVVEEISVRPCDREEAGALGVSPGATALVVNRQHRAGPRVVESADIVIPAQRFRLRYRLPAAGLTLPRPAQPAKVCIREQFKTSRRTARAEPLWTRPHTPTL